MIWVWILLAIVCVILLIAAVAVGVFFGTLYLQYCLFEKDLFCRKPKPFLKWVKSCYSRKVTLEEEEAAQPSDVCAE